ncbi:hypothetical protein Y032_0048g1567 [Ancylostoma ceylanicum]|uniref:Uncharacterized protein n=1 Tax=Ancylostoma ceylanicum TaxID=53326 RepID=A0A016UB37_9BILA|nr:hypothetical protein Y032_0048g1567 [Ancylostoma ceylanicum]
MDRHSNLTKCVSLQALLIASSYKLSATALYLAFYNEWIRSRMYFGPSRSSVARVYGLTMRSLRPHDERRKLRILCRVAGLYQKSFANGYVRLMVASSINCRVSNMKPGFAVSTCLVTTNVSPS